MRTALVWFTKPKIDQADGVVSGFVVGLVYCLLFLSGLERSKVIVQGKTITSMTWNIVNTSWHEYINTSWHMCTDCGSSKQMVVKVLRHNNQASFIWLVFYRRRQQHYFILVTIMIHRCSGVIQRSGLIQVHAYLFSAPLTTLIKILQ